MASSATIDRIRDRAAPRWNFTAVTGALGGTVFLLGTALHPARDGQGVAAAGDLYALTHAVQAIGLMLAAVAIASLADRSGGAPAARSRSWYAALLGTLSWIGLIVYDGAHNPVLARYAPELVHVGGELDPGGAIIAFPALLLFPLGYLLLGFDLARRGRWQAGGLLGSGAAIYTAGGLAIFAAGPSSPVIQPLEVAGALLYAAGLVALLRR